MNRRTFLKLVGLSAGATGLEDYLNTEEGREDLNDGISSSMSITPATATAIGGTTLLVSAEYYDRLQQKLEDEFYDEFEDETEIYFDEDSD